MVISHDRWFLDRIATHVLAFEGDSVVRWFEGNFTEYEEFRHRELGVGGRPAAPDPVQEAGELNDSTQRGLLSALAQRGFDPVQVLSPVLAARDPG